MSIIQDTCLAYRKIFPIRFSSMRRVEFAKKSNGCIGDSEISERIDLWLETNTAVIVLGVRLDAAKMLNSLPPWQTENIAKLFRQGIKREAVKLAGG